MEQQWSVVDITIDELTHKGMKQTTLWRGFQLTLHQAKASSIQEVQIVRAWVDPGNVIWRSVEVQQPKPMPATPNMLFDRLVTGDEVDVHLRELFYLWTCDVDIAEYIQPLVRKNLTQLREKGFRQRDQVGALLAFATVSLYDIVNHEDYGPSEVWIPLRKASTWDELRQSVLELPSDATLFQIHFEAMSHIVGNAEYYVDNELDPATGKRLSLSARVESGVCDGFHKFFDDFYDTSEEYNRHVYSGEK